MPESEIAENLDRNRKPAPTIYDIARVTGVNASTVSRALNKPGRINAETEHRIKSAAAELGYRINPMARALPTGRTGTIGLLLSDFTNPVYFDLVRGAGRVASANGQALIIAESQESGDTEFEIGQRIASSVDGLILVASRMPDDQVSELAEHKSLVLVNRRIDGIASVVPQIDPGIRAAVQHLKELGHSSIAYLAGPKNSWMSSQRWQSLFSYAVSERMSVVEIGPTEPTIDGGRAVIDRVRASGVSGVVAYNDLMAIGLMQAYVDRGLSVPGDLSIIGFDDIFGSNLTTPSITTVRTPVSSLGEHAVRAVMSLASIPASGPEETTQDGEGDLELKTTLVTRESTGPAQS